MHTPLLGYDHANRHSMALTISHPILVVHSILSLYHMLVPNISNAENKEAPALLPQLP